MKKGKVLLIIRFDLLNSKDVAQEIDMLQDNIVYKMIVDDKVINAMITMVGNDLTTLIGSLQPEARNFPCLQKIQNCKCGDSGQTG